MGVVTAVVAALGCAAEPAEPAQHPSLPRPSVRTKLASVAAAPAPKPVPAPAEPVCKAVRAKLPELIPSTIDVAVPAIVDPDRAMTRFYERAARVLAGTAKDHVRIGVFGDSNMTMDWITGEIRRTLQLAHGDAGHGYVALGRPWKWYRHEDVKSGHLELDWKAFAVSTRPARDGAYGFAGIAARSERPGAVTWVATAEAGSPVGTRASRMEVYFLRKPGAGSFELRVDGATKATIATDSPSFEAGFHALEVPDGPHKLELASTTRAPVTLFGATLERSGASFVVDSLGVGAVSGPLLLRQNKDVMRAALAHRNYDLIVLLLGSNQVWPVMYEKQMSELVGRFREAIPDVSVLVMSPVDQVASVTAKRSVPDVSLVARQNQRVARDNHAAFWDFRGAMGGEASMVRFIATSMGTADGIHLTPKGARYMARRVLYALMRGLDDHLVANPKAGCSGDP